ncbi:MAG: hypothetical protein EOP31_26565 [Rhodococcus sp. (in: high G+C Gram-positive bacteria)]|uniref:TY-Chap domain-containing protein n=1 Tax=Rhodococcus sp. TaxID=1831 RepID=UPI0012087DAF|nr:hypothetical protein [Rhodococcus sp. (in: high G+C Gram-positive bacteria)]RZL21847.1 MAG: hypothetical protein EOP31_26565 [Rhodococcus sp. (in: high G+C Gram-positive bacteria)]
MTAEGWDELSAAIPELVIFEFDKYADPIQTGQFVRLRDSRTCRDIMFYENGDTAEARVMVPPDPVAAQQLLSVLQTQPLWFRDYENEQRFITEWEPTDSEPSDLREVSASVVAVMRDGLGMKLERIRYTAGDETGYDTRPQGLRNLLTAEQPTERGAPDRCTEWADFAERLEWVLRTLPQTLPGYDIVTLIAPAVKGLSAIQFLQRADELVAVTEAMNTVTGPNREDLDWQLRANGWQKLGDTGDGFPCWSYGPFSSSAAFGDNRRLASTASLTAATFRTVFGVASPQELAVTSPRDTVVSGRQAYIGRELGIPIQAHEQ